MLHALNKVLSQCCFRLLRRNQISSIINKKPLKYASYSTIPHTTLENFKLIDKMPKEYRLIYIGDNGLKFTMAFCVSSVVTACLTYRIIFQEVDMQDIFETNPDYLQILLYTVLGINYMYNALFLFLLRGYPVRIYHNTDKKLYFFKFPQYWINKENNITVHENNVTRKFKKDYILLSNLYMVNDRTIVLFKDFFLKSSDCYKMTGSYPPEEE